MNERAIEAFLDQKDKKALIDFLEDLVHPEGYGWAVTDEVRARAVILLKLLGERNG